MRHILKGAKKWYTILKWKSQKRGDSNQKRINHGKNISEMKNKLEEIQDCIKTLISNSSRQI